MAEQQPEPQFESKAAAAEPMPMAGYHGQQQMDSGVVSMEEPSQHDTTPNSGLLFRQRLAVNWFLFTFTGMVWTWVATIYIVRASTLTAAAVIWWGLWKLFADYFHARLHKSADLDPSRNYLFAMVPHGIGAVSGWVNFCTEATGFSEKYPGINIRTLTLDGNFKAPLIREYALLHGLRSVSRKSITNILTSGPGSSALLVPGGASESMLSSPGCMDVVLLRRKGFVRLALTTGASLVPVVAFGENELYMTYIAPKGSSQDKALKFMKRVLGFTIPFFWGVGLFGGVGLMPYSGHLNTVVGAPISIPKYAPGMTLEELKSGECISPTCSAESSHGKYVSGQEGQGPAPRPPPPACLPHTGLPSTCSAETSQGEDGSGQKGYPSKQGKQEKPHDPVLEALVDKFHGVFLAAAESSQGKYGSGQKGYPSKQGKQEKPHDPVLEALVDKFHGVFLAAVQNIWDKHKEEYAPCRKGKLRTAAPRGLQQKPQDPVLESRVEALVDKFHAELLEALVYKCLSWTSVSCV
eukprot:gene4294-14404_t